MKIYLVGGAVRDQLLGLPVKEKDWVVVGETAEAMLKKGFRQVGKDFPVFLHPKTHEEYALARTERKVGRGYTGFHFNASPAVTLEEDLQRRDLTINAIAQSADGVLIDPYHGQVDLSQKLLRHVSPAFIEDPVRILRVARFAARFAKDGFRVAPETTSLMQQMVQSGEVDALVAERVWKEWERALQEASPEVFFTVLDRCGALSVLFPEIKLDGSGIQTLEQARHCDAEERFAVLLHDLSPQDIQAICDRYRVPSAYRELAMLVAKYYADYSQADKLGAEALLALLQSMDVFRRVQRFQKFLTACVIIAHVASKPDHTAWLHAVFKAATEIDIKKLPIENLAGKDIAELINKARVQAISRLVKQ